MTVHTRVGEGGEPLALLLLGGGEGARIRFTEIAPLAAEGFDIVALELAAPEPPRSIASQSADLYASLRNGFGFERVTLVGCDLTAAVACDFAMRFPGFAQRLVLVNPLVPAGIVPTETILLIDAEASVDGARARSFPNRVGPLGVRQTRSGDLAAALGRAIRHLCRAERERPGEQTTYVALGSNLGDRERHLAAGFAALRELRGVRDVVASRVYETDPVGPGDQQPYLNAVARLRTRLAPRTLLGHLLAIERGEARERSALRNTPRTLDLDLLLHGACELREPDLVVPHPRIAQRPFVLEPLCDLAADLVIPGLDAPVGALAAAVRDAAAVRVRET